MLRSMADVRLQPVGDLPLVLNLASSIEDVYADWWRKAAEVTAMLATACAIIVSLALILRSELRRRVLAEATLVALTEEDPLTRLANRRRFDGALAEEVHRAVRHGLPLSLLMIDADHFKSFNDAFGHVAGDAALVALVDCLARHAHRPGDLAARYGGEEFAVILPHAAADEALGVAEAIRRSIRHLGPHGPGSADGAFSVSVGIASVVPRSGDEAKHIIEAADAALYRSKADGRDRSTQVSAIATSLPEERGLRLAHSPARGARIGTRHRGV